MDKKMIGLLMILLVTICGCGSEKPLTIESIAYDVSTVESMVYVEEKDGYVPYLVLTADYNENVLLLRKDVLPDTMSYKEHGMFWETAEYGSYYEESSIDEYLNNNFYESLSESIRKAIVDSEIEVTDKDSYVEWNYKTHKISRKIFLLSSVELGVKGLDGNSTAKEGTPLEYFQGKEYAVKKASMSDGKECPYWTRTPELWETSTVIVVGVNAIDSGSAEIMSGVRPAFCMPRNTVIKTCDDIVAGETVYIIE